MKLPSVESFKNDTLNFRVFASVIVFVSILVNLLIYYLNHRSIEKAYRRIWIVDANHRPYLADARMTFDYPERVYEYEETVKEFYENAFSMDDTNLDSNLERALNLSARLENGQTIEDQWGEESIVSNVLENDWRYEAFCDSVLFDLESKPVKGYAFGRQTIKMRRQSVVRNMNFTFVIYDLNQRTRNNPFAARIDRIDIFNNSVISDIPN